MNINADINATKGPMYIQEHQRTGKYIFGEDNELFEYGQITYVYINVLV